MTRIEPPWLAERPVRRLLDAFEAARIEARFVGGCVRDALLGLEIGDLDLATPARPDAVMAALKRARIKAIPTGIEHGTVTAVIGPRHFEITTLRRDVETDGRHAVVAFEAGWKEDAARRDFTINAVYLSPDGMLFDPVNGQADLAAHRVRFVGDAATRIEEDVLRILRYYRFEARFGSGAGNAEARAACRAAVGRLPTLSAERVSRELMRLLAGPDPVRVLSMMRDDGVLGAILPEATQLERLNALTAFSDDPLLRLAALLAVKRTDAEAIGLKLRLSAKERERLAALATPLLGERDSYRAQKFALYRLGLERYRDLALLAAADGQIEPHRVQELLDWAKAWEIPRFPLGGDDVTALGIAPGPRTGQLLAEVRGWWEEGDFVADRAACLAKLKELAAHP